MELGACLLLGRDRTVRKVFVNKLCPAGEFFIAAIQAETHRKTYRATDIMTRDRMVCEGIRIVTMVVMTVDIVEETPHRFTQGIIEDQEPVGLRTAYLCGLLEEILDATVIDTVLEPGCLRKKAGEIGFVGALQHTAGDISQAFVVQNNQTCQVILKMAKLASILKEIAKDVRMGGYDGSRSNDGKLHETWTLSPKGWDRA